ncbi:MULTISPECIES: hypothetical protein [unclassified Leifsonia]|uniref:hypothetical protein n=1 Tax=unclassified Leifsonia TaxID=2663824 RepID=UPI0006F59A9F|nr:MULTISPECIES: hypothetical protein [unclassified Leifsonia]KQX08196.1 hypothetical protein ASC59_11075 [Leifsonia sp. Root1293]KRA12478.1 hypothetical protein ASD61_11075 [Leifsonia sp. Root60]
MPDTPQLAGTAMILGILIWLGGIALMMLLAYVIIRAAVRAALADHYLRVQHYQASGVWNGRRVPRRMPATRDRDSFITEAPRP